MANIVGYKAVNATAAVTPASVTPFAQGNAKKIVFIANDDATNNLWVSLDNSTTESNYLVVLPGEAITDIEIEFNVFWYRSSAATVAFRALITK